MASTTFTSNTRRSSTNWSRSSYSNEREEKETYVHVLIPSPGARYIAEVCAGWSISAEHKKL